MNIKIGDMVEIVEPTKGIDDFSRSYQLLPGDSGLVVEADRRGYWGVFMGGEIIYITDFRAKRIFK